MSVIAIERAAHHGSWSSFAASIGRTMRRLQQWEKRRRDRKHLRELPDHLLRDIGISRFDIDRVTARQDCPSQWPGV